MIIYVDADSCPRTARELVRRAAARRSITALFAANRPIPGLESGEMLLCPPEEGAADNVIAERAGAGDLAVTRDIPLAARLVALGVTVIDDRGRVYSGENIAERLSLRNFTVGLAENGLDFERTKNYGKRESKAFADTLDRILTRLLKQIT
jgi:uncharacterized protein YaiI (UPF0178 family)